MNVNSRIKEFCLWYSKKHGITQKDLSTLLEVSASQLSSIINGRDKVGLIIIEKFLNLENSLNANWLISGKGNMISNINDNTTNICNEDKVDYLLTKPRIPLHASAGSLSFNNTGVALMDCELLPTISSLPKYDFTIFANGDSMMPEYHSGDELACLLIDDKSFIQWGRVHVLDTRQGIVLKRIFEEGEYLVCESNNPRYTGFKVHKTEVFNMALVVGLIRRY